MRKTELKCQKVRKEKDCGIISCRIPVLWDLHFHNITTLLGGTKLKDKSYEVNLEVQQESKLKCPSSSINVVRAQLRGSPSLGL